jgi:hypothetical protein
MRKSILSIFLVLAFLMPSSPLSALTTAPQIAQDKESGYNRSFFKH